MSNLFRRVIAALVIATALIPVVAWAEKPAATAPAAANPLAVAWPQDSSDMPPDPAARFGRLPNGMTYVIYKNATPRGQVAMHLRIAAGSLVENDNELGLAHFVEHMAFNGSRNIPKDALLPLMQRHGLAIGPDAGASTTAEKTEYVFDMPSNDDETIDTALLIAREIAGNLTFEPEAVERERSVVLGEERLRQSPLLASETAWLEAAYPGQKYATRGGIIGQADIICTAPRQTVIDFYHAFYRPETTTLIIVGDIDPDIMEARITAKFSDWTAVGPVRAIDFGVYRKKGGIKTFVREAPSLPDTISVTWFRPWDGKAMGVAETDAMMMDIIVAWMMNRRIQFYAEMPGLGLVAGGVEYASVDHTAKTTQLTVAPRPGQAKVALNRALTAVKQFTQYGPTPEETEQALKTFEGTFQAQLAGARTRTNEEIIDNLVGNLDDRSVFTSPQQDVAWYTGFRQRTTSETLRQHAIQMFAGDGPLLAHMAEDLGGFDAGALKAAYKDSLKQKVVAFGTAAAKAWPYADFGPPQAPVSESAFKDFGFTRYTFANGVRLNLMATDFKDDEVQISVAFGAGLRGFAPDTDAPIGMAEFYSAVGGFMAGGLGKLDRGELQQTLAGRTVSVNYTLNEDAASLSAITTRADFATQLQLLTAFISDPGYRPEMYNQVMAALPQVYAQLNASPQAILGVKTLGLGFAGDHRFVFPDLAAAQATTFEQVRSVYQATLKDAPIEITIVGAIDPAEALKQVELTFGNLAMTPAAPRIAPGGEVAAFPTRDLDQTFYHNGRADQSISLLAWPLTDAVTDTQATHGLEVLTEILNQRLFEQIRQKLGQAYDARAQRAQSRVFKGYGLLQVTASVVAGQDAAFREAVTAIVADLQAHPVSQDELDRARKPLLERREDALRDNGHWVTILSQVATDPAAAAAELRDGDELKAVTPQLIQALAKQYLVSDKALHVKVLPTPVKP